MFKNEKIIQEENEINEYQIGLYRNFRSDSNLTLFPFCFFWDFFIKQVFFHFGRFYNLTIVLIKKFSKLPSTEIFHRKDFYGIENYCPRKWSPNYGHITWPHVDGEKVGKKRKEKQSKVW